MPSKPRAVTVRGKRRWRIEICVDGKRESKTKDTKNEALTWAIERETILSRSGGLIRGKTLGDAFIRFAEEISPERKGCRTEKVRLKKLGRNDLATVPLESITVQDGRDYIAREQDRGLKPNSIIREMNLIKVVVRQCIEWQWLETYPWDRLKMPKAGKPRTRLPTQAEIDLIIFHSGLLERDGYCTTHMQEVAVAFLFAIETAARQGEICSLRPSDIDVDARTANLNDTKNSDSRQIPLSQYALELLTWLEPRNSRVFGMTPDVCSVLFRRITSRAKIAGLNFHDSRAEATTRMSKKLDIFQLARVTGHRDYNMLQIYYRESAADIAKMLD